MKAFPANRVVLILGVIVTVAGAAATYVAGVTNSLPASWQGNAAIIVTVLGGIAGVITAVVKFLDGSQKFDALQAQARAQAASPPAMTVSPPSTTLSAAAPITPWVYTPTATTSVSASAPQPEPAPEPQPDPAPEVVTVDRLPSDALREPNPFNSVAAGFPDPGDQEPAPEPPATEAAQA